MTFDIDATKPKPQSGLLSTFTHPFIRLFLNLWIVIELLMVLLPFVIPNHWYLHTFLSDKAYSKTEEFLAGAAATLPDKDLGWRNRPNFQHDEWRIDQWGGRNHRDFTMKKPPNTQRIVMLGSSLINGSHFVDNNNTMSASLERQYQDLLDQSKSPINIEVLNFATMMYTLDQIKLQIDQQVLLFQPDVLVIGLHEDPTAGLNSIYVPFRLPDEENMPYVKPKFNINGSTLEQLPAPLEKLAPLNDASLHYFKTQDQNYGTFQAHQHFSFMPLTHGLSTLYAKAVNMLGYWTEQPAQFQLLRALMQEIDAVARNNNMQVMYLYLPTPRSLNRPGVWQWMPDYYQQRLKWMRAAWQDASQSHIVDVRGRLRAMPDQSNVYAEDDYHFSKQGNDILAQIIIQELLTYQNIEKTSVENAN